MKLIVTIIPTKLVTTLLLSLFCPLVPAGNYTFKVNKWRRFGVFIVNFEHISHLCSSVSIVNFEQVNAGWGRN